MMCDHGRSADVSGAWSRVCVGWGLKGMKKNPGSEFQEAAGGEGPEKAAALAWRAGGRRTGRSDPMRRLLVQKVVLGSGKELPWDILEHGVLLWMLLTGKRRVLRWFLVVQPVIFYWGWLGFWFLPIGVVDLFWIHSSDREGFVDNPYIAIMSQGAWFWVCGLVWWRVRR